MLNTEKIRLMTDLASYEKNEGEEKMRILEYFRFDYLMHHTAFSFLRYTMCCFLCFAVYLLFHAQDVFQEINQSGVTHAVKHYAAWYAAGLIAYLVITWIVYSIRYTKAEKDIDEYAKKLKKLDRRFNSRGKM